MKKIIEGAKYDTETAKVMGAWDNRCSRRDFQWCEETLYRTKSGKYFLHGEGGPMSKYTRSEGNNSWTGDSRILPMTREAAQEWAEEKLSGDEYEAIFGEVSEEEDGKERLNISVSPALKQKLWAKAEKDGTTMSAMVEAALEKLVE